MLLNSVFKWFNSLNVYDMFCNKYTFIYTDGYNKISTISIQDKQNIIITLKWFDTPVN